MENLGRRQLLYHFSRNSEIIFVFGLFVISIARSRLQHTQFLAQSQERAQNCALFKSLPPLSGKFSNNHPHIHLKYYNFMKGDENFYIGEKAIKTH